VKARSERVRALVYAAGRGERLRPLTLYTPKPLLPIAGEPVAARTLRALRRAGVEAAALNLHHLGDKIRRHFGDEFEGLPLVYSEESELLGTAGALPPLAEFFAGADLVLLVNGDTVCDWPLTQLIERHRTARVEPSEGGAVLTVLLTSRPVIEGFGSGVGVDEAGRVLVFRGRDAIVPRHTGAISRRAVFAGAQVLEPHLLGRVPQGPGDLITELHEPLLREGAWIASLTSDVPWFDLGTPERYREAQAFWDAPAPTNDR
jgi:mannose-1-phosphate guanylyltransferase